MWRVEGVESGKSVFVCVSQSCELLQRRQDANISGGNLASE